MKKLTTLMLIIIGGCNTTMETKKEKPTKLILTNVKDGRVYYDCADSYCYCPVELHFSNPISIIEKKEPIEIKLDNKPNDKFVLLDYEIPELQTERDIRRWNLRLDTIIAITYWDSTYMVPDSNHAGIVASVPKIQYFNINYWMAEGYKVIQLHVPPGTFTDIYGNKNEEINITYQRRKK